MVISLKEVLDQTIAMRSIILVVVAIFITVIVYGAVALIVKMDDMGLSLAQRESTAAQKVGRFMVAAMPKVMLFLSIVGTAAMLWVGGHILLVGLHELGWHLPYDLVHQLESVFVGISSVGGFLAWLANTIVSAIVGFIVGFLIVNVIERLPFGAKREAH